MAYTATVLQDAIYKASKSDVFQSFEVRRSNYGALEAAFMSTNKLLPASEIASVKESLTQANRVLTFAKQPIGTRTARACAGSRTGTSASTTLSWSTIGDDFKIGFHEHMGNYMKYQETFNHLFSEAMRSNHQRLDALVVAALEANYSAGAGSHFTNFNNAKQVPISEHDIANNRAALWLNYVNAELEQNDISQGVRLVGDPFMKSNLSALMAQGGTTATDLSFQFSGMMANFTNRVTNNEGRDATGYIFQDGVIGIIPWTDPQYRNRIDDGADIWDSFPDPVYPINWELKVKRACEDNSGSFTGAEADRTESFVITASFAVPTAYTSDSNTGIYKYEHDNGGNIQSGSGSYS